MKPKMSDISNRIEMWLKAKFVESGASGVVIGLSGGVDSSVVAALAKRALGSAKVLGLLLPCESNAKDAERARIMAKKLGIKTDMVDLTHTFREFGETLPEADKKTLGNLKSRLRMLTLYYYANKNNSLVLGTSNKSEIAIGYFTKHGDAAADLKPIGSLYKTQVLDLAKYLEIPEDIINATPAAGLWDGQTDEGEIGMSYAELDNILKSAENGLRPAGADAKKISLVKEMIKKSVHKRKLPEVCEM
ncbi:MAG: NAD+ synthase [Candidatus Aenigmarchaeota archaeon]|nr:NAD+ synthase [Candidatus Aenigmarchaeota archaeon]